MSANTTYTTCVECDGTGQVAPFEYGGETHTECPWCSGTGRVEVSYVVYGYGWNGDFSFRECYDVVASLDEAKKLAERYMLKDRYNDTLEDGTPTLQWMEVVGQSDELFGVEEKDGKLYWSEA
jgi:hypothetical protein